MGFVSTSKLSNLLERSEEEILDAAQEGASLAGHPVHEWALRGEEGEIYGFEVPQDLQKELGRDRGSTSGLLSPLLE
jgi:hypothetical protein